MDKYKCRSCGVAWGDHLGVEGTCAKLQVLKKEIKPLRRIKRILRKLYGDIPTNDVFDMSNPLFAELEKLVGMKQCTR